MDKDFLEETIKEQELLDISYKQSKQNKVDRQTKERKKLNQKDYKTSWNHYHGVLCQMNNRYLESFSDDLRNSIIKKVRSKNMIRPYTPEEEEILRKGLKENNNG